MVTVLDTRAGPPEKSPARPRPRHPEKANRPDTPVLRKPDWIRVRAPATSPHTRRRAHPARARAAHGVRGGGLPQHRRVLEQAPRHHDDHGRHLHAGLRLLQRARPACPARSMPPSPPTWPTAVAKLGLAHVVITSVDRDDLADGGAAHFAADHPRHPARHARDHHRGADPRLPAQGRRARDR